MNRKDRRSKARQSQGTPPSNSGFWSNMHTYNGPKEDQPPPKTPVPGLDIPPVDSEFEAKVARNSWHDRNELDEVIKVIQKLSIEKEFSGTMVQPIGTVDKSEPSWSWARNTDCKYVSINFDMRDGAFTLLNQNGERINLDQLKWQWKENE